MFEVMMSSGIYLPCICSRHLCTNEVDRYQIMSRSGNQTAKEIRIVRYYHISSDKSDGGELSEKFLELPADKYTKFPRR